MKYIRTKDGIKEYSFTCDLSYAYQCIGGIKVADTVEELCDEFVQFSNRLIVITQATIRGSREPGKTPIIYGAIWTEWGLKYVAKMNDKGELELL